MEWKIAYQRPYIAGRGHIVGAHRDVTSEGLYTGYLGVKLF